MDVDALIKQYIGLRDYVDTRKKSLEMELTDYKDGIAAIGATLGTVLSDLDVDSLRCDSGTAYNRRTTSARVTDPAVFLEFLMSTGLWELLDMGIDKTALNAYLANEENGLPPGVEVSFLTLVQVRKK